MRVYELGCGAGLRAPERLRQLVGVSAEKESLLHSQRVPQSKNGRRSRKYDFSLSYAILSSVSFR